MLFTSLWLTHVSAHVVALFYVGGMKIPEQPRWLTVVLFNEILGFLLSHGLDALNLGEILVIMDKYPIWYMIPVDLFVIIILHDLYFGFIHHSLHYIGYKYVHKWHHRFRIADPLATFYAHPIEHIIANMFPFILCLCTLRVFNLQVHAVTALLFAFIGTFNTVAFAHDGLSSKADGHVQHHLRGGHPYGNWPYLYDFITG